MRLQRVSVLMVLLLTASPIAMAASCGSTPQRVSINLPDGYRASCAIGYSAPVNVTVVKGKVAVRHYSLSTITQPMVLRPVKLENRHGQTIQALFVQCSGGSASHDYIFEISARGGKKLLYGLEKGGVDYGHDCYGRLTGVRFHYYRWHMDNECHSLSGHVLTAIDYTWLPERQAFRQGQVHVDREAEHKASLLDILSAIGSDAFLPVAYARDTSGSRIAYYYRPVGILREKTPVELRSATRVKVEVAYESRKTSYGETDVPRIVSMSRAEN